jgi:hypothetical protein
MEDRDRVRRLVDRYVKVTEMISRLQAEADSIRDQLVELIPDTLVHNSHRVTVVRPVRDVVDAQGLWSTLRKRGLLTPRVRRLFKLTIPVSSLWDAVDRGYVPREIVPRHVTQQPGRPYIRVTKVEEEESQ